VREGLGETREDTVYYKDQRTLQWGRGKKGRKGWKTFCGRNGRKKVTHRRYGGKEGKGNLRAGLVKTTEIGGCVQ